MYFIDENKNVLISDSKLEEYKEITKYLAEVFLNGITQEKINQSAYQEITSKYQNGSN